MQAEAAGDVPANANENCPGTAAAEAGKAASCQGCPNQQACATAPKGTDPDLEAIAERLTDVQRVILVLSGKGGVGKSTFATQCSFALAKMGKQVGLLDIDICGPSLPKMLGLQGQEIHQSNSGWSPVYVEDNLGVMSIGFMLPDPDDAVIWRGPRKNSLIKQFLKDVNWGELDYLVIDSPPGTSDEHITIAQLLKSAANVAGAIVVTTPQEVSLMDVRKEINFCKKVGIPVLGVVENMSGLQVKIQDLSFMRLVFDEKEKQEKLVDATQEVLSQLKPEMIASAYACTEVFSASSGGAEKMAADMGVPFLGRVPLDPQLCRAAEQGMPSFEGSPSSAALNGIVNKAVKLIRT